jgi:hypothetical protein
MPLTVEERRANRVAYNARRMLDDPLAMKAQKAAQNNRYCERKRELLKLAREVIEKTNDIKK